MMPSWFGSLAPWLIVAGLWIGFSLLFALAFGMIERTAEVLSRLFDF